MNALGVAMDKRLDGICDALVDPINAQTAAHGHLFVMLALTEILAHMLRSLLRRGLKRSEAQAYISKLSRLVFQRPTPPSKTAPGAVERIREAA